MEQFTINPDLLVIATLLEDEVTPRLKEYQRVSTGYRMVTEILANALRTAVTATGRVEIDGTVAPRCMRLEGTLPAPCLHPWSKRRNCS